MSQANTRPNNKMSTHASKQPSNQPRELANVSKRTSMQEASKQTFNQNQKCWNQVRGQRIEHTANQTRNKPAQPTK